MLEIKENEPYLSFDEFNKHLKLMRETPILHLDTEGTINHPNSQTWGISTSVNGISEYFAFNHKFGPNLPGEWFPLIKEEIENHRCLDMWNAKHDLRSLRSMGINYTGKFYCGQQMTHWNNENLPSKELDYIARMALGRSKERTPEMNAIIKAFGWPYIPAWMMRQYAYVDAELTEELFYPTHDEFILQGFDGELWDIEQDWIRLMGDLEDVGLLIDESFAQSEYNRGISIMTEIEKYLGFNPGSPTQMAKFILEDLGLPVEKRTKKGAPSFDKEAMKIYDEKYLAGMNDNRAKQIMIWKGWQKVTSSSYLPFLNNRDIDGRLHPSYKLHGTKTGRMSCGYFMQIPRESENDWNGQLKTVFIPDEGYTRWEVDFSQVEFRLGAAYGEQKNLIEIFDDPNRDLFTEMAEQLGLDRNSTKTMAYTLQFLGGAGIIANRLGRPEEWARDQVRNYWNKYRGIWKINKKVEAKAKERGYVKLWTGRRRHLDYESNAHKMFNSLCQGGAFEIVKRAMLRTKKRGLINDECKMDIQVHDSAGFLIKKGKEDIYLPEIKDAFEAVDKDFGVKFRVDVHEWAKRDAT